MEIKRTEELLCVTTIQALEEKKIFIEVVSGNYDQHVFNDIVLEDLSDEEYENIMKNVKPGDILTSSFTISKV